MADLKFVEKEIAEWKFSAQRIKQIKAFRYYDGDHDIIKRIRE